MIACPSSLVSSTRVYTSHCQSQLGLHPGSRNKQQSTMHSQQPPAGHQQVPVPPRTSPVPPRRPATLTEMSTTVPLRYNVAPPVTRRPQSLVVPAPPPVQATTKRACIWS
jgi:hypothetical protein